MSDTPSARPPRKDRDRFQVLDNPAAKRFIDAAGADQTPSSVGGEAPAVPPPAAAPPRASKSTAGRGAMPAAIAESELGPLLASLGIETPAGGFREQPFPLRIEGEMHALLTFIKQNTPKSINRFIQDALRPAVRTEVEKILRRKAAGLD